MLFSGIGQTDDLSRRLDDDQINSWTTSRSSGRYGRPAPDVVPIERTVA